MSINTMHQKLALERVGFCLAQLQLYLTLYYSQDAKKNLVRQDHFEHLLNQVFSDLRQIEISMAMN